MALGFSVEKILRKIMVRTDGSSIGVSSFTKLV